MLLNLSQQLYLSDEADFQVVLDIICLVELQDFLSPIYVCDTFKVDICQKEGSYAGYYPEWLPQVQCVIPHVSNQQCLSYLIHALHAHGARTGRDEGWQGQPGLKSGVSSKSPFRSRD